MSIKFKYKKANQLNDSDKRDIFGIFQEYIEDCPSKDLKKQLENRDWKHMKPAQMKDYMSDCNTMYAYDGSDIVAFVSFEKDTIIHYYVNKKEFKDDKEEKSIIKELIFKAIKSGDCDINENNLKIQVLFEELDKFKNIYNFKVNDRKTKVVHPSNSSVKYYVSILEVRNLKT